ncbi:MAG: hypothetical protein U9O56_09400 [Campylobacterota bacterium]|nr:hypothetical protein [Campylobacterota bacterium]
MQVFGKFKVIHELEYLVKTYLYISEDKDDICDVDRLNLLLKRRNKNVAGTLFLYNPATAPIGYKVDERLQNQDFVFDNNFVEIQLEDAVRIVGKNLKRYRGKLIEIKYLFNYNKKDIQPTSTLEVFDMDLEKLQTNLLTVFAKQDNFHDYKNISYNGQFIFFAWGHKFDRHHTNISTYAANIAQWAKKTGKAITFVYDGSQEEDYSFEYTRFIVPDNFGKLKSIVPFAIGEIFDQDTIKPYCIKNLK